MALFFGDIPGGAPSVTPELTIASVGVLARVKARVASDWRLVVRLSEPSTVVPARPCPPLMSDNRR